MAMSLCSFTPTTATPTPSGGSCGLRPSASMSSLASRATLRSLSPPAPPSSGHGNDGRQRRFSSRHVPKVAEEIAHSEVMNPSMERRFTGLMRYLKKNSVAEDQQKQVLQVQNAEMLVPEEYEDALLTEYERRCAFGERMNTELMSSAKWVKLLRDLKAISASGTKAGGVVTEKGAPTMTLAEADIIFHKVLHNCDHGGQRLTYELFCKAISIAGQVLRPTLDGEAAISEISQRIAALAPQEPEGLAAEMPDLMLDANVLLVLDHFKPALHDLFAAFCTRNLGNPASASRGMGAVRIRERTTWRHTQDTILSTYMSKASGGGGGRQGLEGSPRVDAVPTACTLRDLCGAELKTGTLKDMFGTGKDVLAKGEAKGPEVNEGGLYSEAAPPPSGSLGASSLGSSGHPLQVGSSGNLLQLPVGKCPGAVPPPASPVPRVQGGGSPQEGGSKGPILAWAESRGYRCGGEVASTGGGSPRKPVGTSGTWKRDDCASLSGSPMGTRNSTIRSNGGQAPKDPYVYANGAPVIKDRRHNMSSDQMLSWCKELQIMPELLSRLEVLRIFKRAQCSGSAARGSSYGYLSKEAFVDAVGQLAIEAYSKEPFCEEYPEAHEKIHAFLLTYLPGNSREAHERFLYGTSGRGN